MAGTITALVIQQKNKERVNVFIDNNFALAISLNAALSLKKGQFLDTEAINNLKYQDSIDHAYQQALNYLSYRPRSQQEVEQYLQKKETSAEIIEQIIQKLVTYNYLNDTTFSRLWVENRNRLNPKGPQALRYELKQKGISDTIIEDALSDLDEESLALQAVQKKLAGWKKLDSQQLRKKLTGYLSRRGFRFETINTIYQKILEQD